MEGDGPPMLVTPAVGSNVKSVTNAGKKRSDRPLAKTSSAKSTEEKQNNLRKILAKKFYNDLNCKHTSLPIVIMILGELAYESRQQAGSLPPHPVPGRAVNQRCAAQGREGAQIREH